MLPLVSLLVITAA